LSRIRKRYWLYIDSYIYISQKKGNVVFYNPYTGKIVEYKKNKTISRLAKQLTMPGNLLVISITEKDLNDPEIRRFVDDIRTYYMGDLLAQGHSKQKPIQMPAYVKIQRDIKYLRKDANRSVGEVLINYLDEITFYLNDSCSQHCSFCQIAFKQVPCCTARKGNGIILDINSLEKIIDDISGWSVSKINISGGNILAYPFLERFILHLNSLHIPKTFYIHYLNAFSYLDKLKIICSSYNKVKILIGFPFDVEAFKKVNDFFQILGIELIPCFLIQNVDEFDQSKKIIPNFKLESAMYYPVYNGYNMDFFREYIFVRKEDIEENRPTLRQIYINTVLNSEYFGKINIFPDGSIFSSLNMSKLGNLKKNSLYDTVFKEMKEGKSWFKRRRFVMPCKQCNYEYLCPPITSYNIIAKKYDFCHIWNHWENVSQ